MRVLAVLNGTGVYLSKDEQMDKFLSNGYTLYLEDEKYGKYILATPEEGFVRERPIINKTTTYILKVKDNG